MAPLWSEASAFRRSSSSRTARRYARCCKAVSTASRSSSSARGGTQQRFNLPLYLDGEPLGQCRFLISEEDAWLDASSRGLHVCSLAGWRIRPLLLGVCHLGPLARET